MNSNIKTMRKKLNDVDKKVKTGITINDDLLELMDEYLDEMKTNRSRYVEKLVREDLERRGIKIEKKF